MNYTIYLVSTLGLYIAQIVLSIIVDDLGLIFEFISAISISALAFIFPGVFYIIAERKFGTTQQKIDGKNMRIRAWFFIIFGFFAFLF